MKLYAFDTEDDGAANFTQGGVFDGERFQYFDTREDMGEFIRTTRGRFYTFNLEYDLVSLYWPDLAVVRFWRSNGRILSARVGVAGMFDLVWLMGGVGMAFSAGLLGLKKGKLDARSREYLRNDLLNTWAVLQRVIEENAWCGLETRGGTLAGTSLKVFKSFGGEIPEFPSALESVVRAAYYGGRTECFDYRERTVNGYDVNSMFPAAMLSGDFPSGRYKSTRDIDRADFVAARVRVPPCHVPVLPFRGERLIFPTGRFSGVWAGEELRYAVEQGAVVERVKYAFRAVDRVRPFDAFCSALFERRAHDAFSNYYAKRLMNSLYGKLAQQGTVEYVTGFMDAPDVKELEIPARDYCPAWPAIITARARVQLHKYLVAAGKSLVYCDTDSIFSGAVFPTGAGLGELKEEHRRAKIRVLAPKLYRLKESGKTKYRSRGVPGGGNDDGGLNPSRDFYELGEAKYKKPLRLYEAIRRRLKPNVWTELEKHFGADTFDKRRRLPDGRTVPLEIGG